MGSGLSIGGLVLGSLERPLQPWEVSWNFRQGPWPGPALEGLLKRVGDVKGTLHFTVLYKELEHLWILISDGDPEKNPLVDTEGQL